MTRHAVAMRSDGPQSQGPESRKLLSGLVEPTRIERATSRVRFRGCSSYAVMPRSQIVSLEVLDSLAFMLGNTWSRQPCGQTCGQVGKLRTANAPRNPKTPASRAWAGATGSLNQPK